MYTCISETSDKALFLSNPFWVYKMSGFIVVLVPQIVPVNSKICTLPYVNVEFTEKVGH